MKDFNGMKEQQTVFVGLSGGVDSSVAALRLKNQGYNVVGVFIKVWHPEWLECNWEQERLDAMRVAAHLDIPFLTCNAEQAYRDNVAEYFIREYEAGRVPNPDVMCNQHVKFGAFLDFAKARGADFIATGHYVQRVDTTDGPALCTGVDPQKDQSYFLWSLTEEQLKHSLFPVGSSEKSVIRTEAARAGIPTATKKDSQGVCFLGHIDIPEFLSHYIQLESGAVINESGETIGKHKGALVYTIGQRHGFLLHSHNTTRSEMFVVAKDIAANTLTVSAQRPRMEASDTVTLTHTTLRQPVRKGDTYLARCHYRQQTFTVTVQAISGDTLTLQTASPTEQPVSGQSCVLYSTKEPICTTTTIVCIGGGIIA